LTLGNTGCTERSTKTSISTVKILTLRTQNLATRKHNANRRKEKIHSRHHLLYAPYAFGGQYNHPLEGFFMDTVGSTLAYQVARLNLRQGIFFFIASSLKVVDDTLGPASVYDEEQCAVS